MKHYIYADNAATTKLDIDVFEAMKPYLLDEYGNASQPYSFSRSAKSALKQARQTIASCINADTDEIFFTSGGTESDNWALKGSAFIDTQKRTIITSAFEHHAILNSCIAIERLGYPIIYLAPTNEGIITVEELSKNITATTNLVSVMFANNEIGSIQPIKELCLIAHHHRATFHTDAVQAVGHVKIDVKDLGVDMLSASAHKFNGPKGVGFLYIRKGTMLSPYADGGSQEHRFRAGTENVASIVGMAVALKKNCDAMDQTSLQLKRLELLLLNGLDGIQYRRNGAQNHIPGNISLSFPGFDGETILHRMDLCGIAISTGSACDSKNSQISHVLKAIKLDEIYATGTVRISLGKYNTDVDVVEIVNALRKIIK